MYQQINASRRALLPLWFAFSALFSSVVMAEEPDNKASFTSTTASYTTPDVSVLSENGNKLSFLKELDDGRPVFMNFIFASCSAICPMLSHVFAKVQDKLEKKGQKFHLVSISIDPENDTPSKLNEYAHKFAAGPNWNFYTGTVETSLAIQKAFNVYRGDKMNHSSVFLMRAAPGKSWLRLDGFMSPDEIIHQFDELKQK